MQQLTRETMKVGGAYNWKNQPDLLIYLGRNWSGNGYWHQFKKIGDPRGVWCEVLDSDLHRLEETLPDDQEWDRRAEQITRAMFGADVDRPINPNARTVDEL